MPNVLTERTVVDQIELCRNGVVRVRFVTEILRGEEIIGSSFHRVEMQMIHDVNATLELIQNSLPLIGKPKMDVKEIAEVKAACTYHRGRYNESIQTVPSSAVQG